MIQKKISIIAPLALVVVFAFTSTACRPTEQLPPDAAFEAPAVKAENRPGDRFIGAWVPPGEAEGNVGVLLISREEDQFLGELIAPQSDNSVIAVLELKLKSANVLVGTVSLDDRKFEASAELTPETGMLLITFVPEEGDFEAWLMVRDEFQDEVLQEVEKQVLSNEEKAAVQKVLEDPKVAEMLKAREQDGALIRTSVDAKDANGFFVIIRVFEVVGAPDSPVSRTLGWYRVDLKTGDVTRTAL